MPLILTQAQAEAVYSAMCALNNVGGRLTARLASARCDITEYANGSITVDAYATNASEIYDNESDFATAYGLARG